jgi:hypothetical protein
MKVSMKAAAVGGAVILAMLVTVSLFHDATFLATSATTPRLLVSIGVGILATLCAVAAAALFACGYFFLKMVNSPQPGKTVFDARMFKGKSLFSDAYLSNEGRDARSNLYKSLIYFLGSWIGAACIGVAMQLSFKGSL